MIRDLNLITLSSKIGNRDHLCRGTLFDGGVSAVFDVVPEAGSRVSVERMGTGNRNRPG